jgi:predicted nucleic acid-binding protein
MSRAVLEVVRDSDFSAYDCEFIALAKKPPIKLATRDTKLLKIFPTHAVSLSGG